MRYLKSNRLSLVIFLLLTISVNSLLAQEMEDNNRKKQGKRVSDELLADIEQLLELVTEQTDESFDFDTFLEQLIDLAKKPLNLNKATYEDLLNIRLLTYEQVNALMQHRAKFGNFISIYELQSIEGLDQVTIERILPFVKVKDDLDDYQVQSVKQMLFDGNYQFFTRFTQIVESKKGYEPLEDGETGTRYLGNPSKLYLRFRYNFANKLSYGFTMEKDPGEQIFGTSQPRGFDFYSGHLFFRNASIFKSVALGDYEVKIGQGLIMWSGFGFGKTAMATNIKRDSEVLRAYTSVDENRFLRGVANTVKLNDIEITTFFSRDRKDANVAETDTFDNDAIGQVTSLQESGLHRTPSELANKDALTVTTYGGHVKYRKRISNFGLTVTHTTLSASLNRTPRIYNLFEFAGSQVTNYGFDYSLLIKNFYFFGEVATSNFDGVAMVNGFVASLDPKVDLAVSHRYYQRNYQGLFSNAFGETRNAFNENGIYAGLTIKPVRAWRIDTYIDFYKFPWLRSQVDAPSSGVDFLFQATWKPSKKLEMYGRYKNEVKQGNLPNNQSKIDVLTDVGKQNIRFHISYRISPSFVFKNRFEYVIFEEGDNKENGYMIYQDIVYQPLSVPVSFAARFALFDTDSYDSRIYAYENDVLYSFSIPPYSFQGTRFYLTFRYKIVRGIDIWLRYAQTWFSNKNTIGSGLEEINGSTRTEIKAQVRFSF